MFFLCLSVLLLSLSVRATRPCIYQALRMGKDRCPLCLKSCTKRQLSNECGNLGQIVATVSRLKQIVTRSVLSSVATMESCKFNINNYAQRRKCPGAARALEQPAANDVTKRIAMAKRKQDSGDSPSNRKRLTFRRQNACSLQQSKRLVGQRVQNISLDGGGTADGVIKKWEPTQQLFRVNFSGGGTQTVTLDEVVACIEPAGLVAESRNCKFPMFVHCHHRRLFLITLQYFCTQSLIMHPVFGGKTEIVAANLSRIQNAQLSAFAQAAGMCVKSEVSANTAVVIAGSASTVMPLSSGPHGGDNSAAHSANAVPTRDFGVIELEYALLRHTDKISQAAQYRVPVVAFQWIVACRLCSLSWHLGSKAQVQLPSIRGFLISRSTSRERISQNEKMAAGAVVTASHSQSICAQRSVSCDEPRRIVCSDIVRPN